MPKALSLKKNQKTGPPKNQKAITQFFKNEIPSATQNNQTLTKTQSDEVETKSCKRKARSSNVLETIEIDDDPCTSNGSSRYPELKNGLHVTKKIKISKDTSEKAIKISPFKKSPQKENNAINVTPVESVHHSSLETINNFEDSIVKQDRSPLTPINFSANGEFDAVNNGSNKSSDKSELNIENGNHEIKGRVTPKKVLQFDYEKGITKEKTPKKGGGKVLLEKILRTPEKLSKNDLSPSKSGSTVKTLEFSPGSLDGFGDQWDLDQIDENCKEDLDLTSTQRCEVLSVTQHQGRLEVRLRNANNNTGTSYVEGVWLDTPLSPGEIISITATRNSTGQWYVSNSSGLISLRPDHLISSTSVVAGVFCKRKAILQERWRGLDSGNTAMAIGILIHELVQKALTQHIMEVSRLQIETDNIIKDSIQTLYDAGISEKEARSNMQIYIQPLADFMQTYVAKSPLSKQPQKDQWSGHVDKVLDIEENLCCPQLGLKGKIDATLQVTIHELNGRQRAIVPLELKSGKASVSAEHRGQVVLYGMMLSLLRNEDPTTAPNSGLLLYLKERVDLREVNCGYPERRDLVMLRNQLVQYLAKGPHDIDPEQLTDIEDASCVLQQKLPEPIHHLNACTKCPYLTVCSLHLWHTDGPSVSQEHPLSKLRDQALSHLSTQHIHYFLHWVALLRMEEQGQINATPLHALWTDSVEKRSKRGTCAANLKLKSVQASGDRYLHVFERRIKEIDSLNTSINTDGPQEGEFSIVSVDGRPWIAAGAVTLAKEKEINILLERDLSRRQNQDVVYHIDTYESYATTVHNLTNLGVLLEDSERSERLRKLIIDKEPPEFEKKLPREVGRLGSKLMKSLNIEQQRAVLKALSVKDYALLQGLPGTGKTQTISVLIQMLVGLKQRVLVTAHTHSAVDTVLCRLPDSLKVMRLGSSARVSTSLLNRCEQQLVAKCDNVKQLEELYESMEVVGVTCLGAAHTMLTRTTFDICIVDEATQVLQSTVLRPLFAARRFVLVGDPEQLPPVVRSRAARRLGMEESMFHRLMNEAATSTLQLQYRMNQPLADIANQVAYNSRLKCADQAVAQASLDVDVTKLSHQPEWLQSACSPEQDYAALFLDTNAMKTEINSKSCSNVLEACVIMALVEALLQGGIKPTEIGIIAPYRDQVSLLRRVLSHRGVDCSTVDQFQGRDKSVILYSCTKHDGQDERKIKEGEILNDKRRLAVSVTRAKHKLLIVGNSNALHRYATLQRLIETCTTLPLKKQVLCSVVNKYKNEFV